MRISDWSSDVCSSDLCDDEDRGAGIDDDFQQLDIALNRAARGVGAAFVNLVAEAERLADRHRDEEDDRGGRDIADEGDERRGRSEEHTSELQSLMRISYAVFCLNTYKAASPTRWQPRTTTSRRSRNATQNT